eukprot:TRINITY_DN6613_c0_g1_i1.p1 TRINITY_DN6613_c0_g1~~TRINITY_DN6613_c0_g1_i1.p1  ORF type:complete len:799 (+),score=214.64 TRINITY_DN6613_c0_g1_i1:212-2398(+)
MKNWKADVVLHDGSPNMGQAWLQDAYTQADLVLKSLALACDILRADGTFVTKVFRSSDYNSLLYVFNRLFKRVHSTKPPASRNTSAEIYVICTGFLKPKKIDPRLLSSKYIFSMLNSAPAATSINILKQNPKKKPRHRDGYEDGVNILFKQDSVANFIASDDPIGILSRNNVLDFDADSEIYLHHPLTTEEIKACCADLKVLGKGDFRNLLKWQKTLKALKEKNEAEAKEEPNVTVEPLSLEQQEDLIDKELGGRLARVKQEKLRTKKKKKKRREREKKRLEFGLGVLPSEEFVQEDEELFALKEIKGKGTVQTLRKGDIDEASAAQRQYLKEEENDRLKMRQMEIEENNRDDIEGSLDNMYEAYVARHGKNLDRLRRRQQRNREKLTVKEDDEDEGIPEDDFYIDPQSIKSDPNYNDLETAVEFDEVAEWEEQQADNDLIVRQPSEAVEDAQKVAMWFGQDIFKNTLSSSDDDDEDDEEDDDSEAEYFANKAETSIGDGSGTTAMETDNADGFEEVPRERRDDEDGETFEAESDLEDRAVTLAIAKQMMKSKKRKREMEDDAYNRYAFNDTYNAPLWFIQDEENHNKISLPVTKEEVDALKDRERAINARPIKKIAEAKARKRRRLQRKLSRAQDKAESINNQADMSEKAKADAINTLYKKALKTGKQQRRLIVRTKGSKGSAAGGGKKIKLVDARLRNDTRATKRQAKAANSGGKRKKKRFKSRRR